MAADQLAVVLVGVGDPRQGELPQVAQTHRPLASFPHGLGHGDEDRQQQGDDRDHHEQFDEGEARGMTG
jgi:hypothetical protein